MLTKFKKLFVLVMFAAFVFVLVGCKSDLEVALEGLEVPTEVKEDFTLPSAALDGAVTTWASSDEAVIKLDGTYAEVYRPTGADAEVKLTATVTLGEESQNKEFVVKVKSYEAPDKITIKAGKLKFDEAKGGYLLIAGEENAVQLEIEVADEEMSTAVVWQVSSQKRASITEDGVLTGKDYGEVKVTAISKAGSIQDQIKVFVVEDTNPQKVLLNNKKAIEAQIPRFVTEDMEFPMAPNEDVTTVYKDTQGNELYYGEYVYIYDETSVDRQETLYCTLAYEGNEIEFEFVICIVGDAEENEFLALDYAKEKLDALLSGYASGTKFAADLEVPEAFSAEEAMYDVALSYDVLTDYQPNPISVKKIGEEGAEKLMAVYNKPNDDATVRLEIYCKTANNDAVYRYNVKTAGYTQDEIVEYISSNVLPQPNEAGEYKLVCQHITLPTSDTTNKFGKLSIEWATSDATVLTAAGKFANPGLAAQTSVTLTANIKYEGTIDGSFAFEKTVSIEFDLYPAENKAQAIALQISNYIDAPEFYDKIKYFPFGKTDRLDADGNITNVMPLPKTVAELTTELPEYKDMVITWTSTEEGLIDENGKLLKQYLRYHEAVLVYEIEAEDGSKATGEVVINVGVAEVKNTIYIGGPSYQQSTTDQALKGDVLGVLSKFDAPVGTLSNTYKTWGKSNGQFSGLTWYIDVYEEDAEGNKTDKFTRYQYYVPEYGYLILDDQYSVSLTDPTDTDTLVVTVNAELNPLFGEKFAGNWPVVFYNASDEAVKVPFSPLSGQAFLGSEEVKWGNHPWTKAGWINRDNSISIDGHRPGFVVDKDGVVILGDGSKNLFVNYDANEDGQLTEDDYWITIPAGGYAYTPRTQQNNIYHLTEFFCTKGNQLTFIQFEAYHKSADGSTDGLGSYVH